MSATRAPSAAPHNAVLCWMDDRHVYCEVPGPKHCALFSFPISEQGLSKALNLLRTQRYDYGGKPIVAHTKRIETPRQALVSRAIANLRPIK